MAPFRLGLVGAGRTELARAVFGADPFDSGRVFIDGQPAAIRSPQDAIRRGVGLVPEDRKQQALFLALGVRFNLSMAAHERLLRGRIFIDEAAERRMVDEYRKALNIRMASQDQTVANLSGGNQQKVVLARWLALQPKVLIVDEPTRGIDIGTKRQIYALVRELAAAGSAVLLFTSELSEIALACDRAIVLFGGRVVAEMPVSEADEATLLRAAHGLAPQIQAAS